MARSAAAKAAVILLVLLASWLGAAGASALVVRLPGGHSIGIAPTAAAALRASVVQPNVDPGDLAYQGGPVVHSSAPYLIFWDPSSVIPASTQTLLARYFTDVAHDSGLGTNDYGVVRQYGDRAGIADYAQTFSPSQVIQDTSAYPARDTTNCPQVDATYYPTCVTDTQLRAELQRLISANGLPTDGLASRPEPVPNAPVYFMVVPGDVNVCFANNPSATCAAATPQSAAGFCAFHNYLADGASNVLYAAIPLVTVESGDPAIPTKNCQYDNNSTVQEPNGTPADLMLSDLTHEDIESITDPLITGWYDGTSLHEIGDNCTNYGPMADPLGFASPFAFAPTLGGSEPAGTLFNQLDNGDQYYVQSMWSNGDGSCEHRPSAGTIAASFTTPSATQLIHRPVSFAPAASSSTAGYSSVAWNFGDGTSNFESTATTANPAPVGVAHTYSAPGTYTVTLRLIDTKGNLAGTARTVTVETGPPAAAFSFSPGAPVPGRAVAFRAAASDPNSGGSISSYGWSFGDGTVATGAAPSHTYHATGTYTVKLTVTDNFGLRTGATRRLTVTPVGKPTSSRESLSGVGKGKPKLTFQMVAGRSAPNLEAIVIRLPSGLSFRPKGLARGLSVNGAGAGKSGDQPTLSHGNLTIELKRPASRVRLTISRLALRVTRSLQHKVSHRTVKALKVGLTVIDRSGTQTKLTLRFGV